MQFEHLTQIETYIDENLYYKIYSSTKFVEAIEHSSKEWLARIYHHDDGRYEIEYSNWSEGRAGGMWAVTARRFNTVTYASDLESAREAALLELEKFAAGTYT